MRLDDGKDDDMLFLGPAAAWRQLKFTPASSPPPARACPPPSPTACS